MIRFSLLAACGILLPSLALAGPDFSPDPASVQRHGKGYRYPQAGWTVVHIEGEPYERGVQHGRLLAPEIAAHVRCFAAVQSPKAPAEGWKLMRTLCNALFQRRYHREFLEEMKGIADGASAAGARFDGRPIDLLDIVAVNAWAEIDTLDAALEATATGLEGIRFPKPGPAAPSRPKGEHCSAFAAVGPATRDGKIVFGHITMFALYPSNFYNVWLDVKPARGHRVFMQSYPGGVQSGMDYYFNDAGLLVCETTIQQTRFDATGLTVASRIRQALQYAGGIDEAVALLKEGNNGLYTNEWLLADTRSNEIAMFELGTGKSRLYRSSQKEWIGGTDGFYWGCNNTKDLQVRLETLASVDGRPGVGVFKPSVRDRAWLKLYDAHKGKIDADFARLAFTTPPLAAYPSLDAKFTTTDLARELKTWALFGPPLGRTWQPTFEERQKYPEVQPLVGNGWTLLHAGAPADVPVKTRVVDLHDPAKRDSHGFLSHHSAGTAHGALTMPNDAPGADESAHADDPPTVPAWHGTLLPRGEADTWLATAFARYERIVALEDALRERGGGQLKAKDRERLALALFEHRAHYHLGARAGAERPLAQTRSDPRGDAWYHVAEGKGVLLLHELRGRLGAEKFAALMDEFGRAHAGRPTGTDEFRATVEKAAGGQQEFFNTWLNETGLPGKKDAAGRAGRGSPLIADGVFSVLTFYDEQEQALIVYGTAGDENVNREAAEALQQAVRERFGNFTIPAKADRDVSEAELKSHHVVLIGRPDGNTVLAKWRQALPVSFGPHSFTVRDESYAHPETAVLAAGENPLNRRFAVVAVAGLSARATLRAAPLLAAKDRRHAEVVVLRPGEAARSLVLSER